MPTRRRRLVRTVACTLVTAWGFAAVGLWEAAPPAYAEVATAQYTIGTPTNAVASVVASPATLSQSAPSPFVVKFRATVALSGTGASTVTVNSSTALATAPNSVSLVDDTDTACFQAGTNGGPLEYDGVHHRPGRFMQHRRGRRGGGRLHCGRPSYHRRLRPHGDDLRQRNAGHLQHPDCRTAAAHHLGDLGRARRQCHLYAERCVVVDA